MEISQTVVISSATLQNYFWLEIKVLNEIMLTHVENENYERACIFRDIVGARMVLDIWDSFIPYNF